MPCLVVGRPKIVGFLNLFTNAQLILPMGVNAESMFLVFAIDNGLKNFLLCHIEVEVILHQVRDQRSR
jgi:hypothetical protein